MFFPGARGPDQAMATDDMFEPELGRIGDRRGNGGRRSAFAGSRIGRGAGAGRLLARRDRYAA